MKRLIFLGLMAAVLILVLGACGFDEEKAINDSKEQLEIFFNTYEDMEIVSSSSDKEDLKKAIDDSFSDFFTKEYLNKIDKEIEGLEKNMLVDNLKSPLVFFLNDSSWEENFVIKFNQYKISEENEFIANKEDETVTTKIVGVGTPNHMFVQVAMKEEGGKWKIDSVEKYN